MSMEASQFDQLLAAIRGVTGGGGGGGGDASAANQATQITAEQAINGKMVAGSGATTASTQRVVLATDSPGIVTPGQAAMAASTPVVIASNQSAVPTKLSQLTGAPSNFSVATADGTVFTLAAGEIGFIQNLDAADALAVKKGASASTSSFNFILPCGNAADDGKGGSVLIDDWVGAVSVATMTGTARYIAWKQAP